MAHDTNRQLVATWSDKGLVHVWDATKHVALLDSPSVSSGNQRLKGYQDNPLFTYSGHKVCTVTY